MNGKRKLSEAYAGRGLGAHVRRRSTFSRHFQRKHECLDTGAAGVCFPVAVTKDRKGRECKDFPSV